MQSKMKFLMLDQQMQQYCKLYTISCCLILNARNNYNLIYEGRVYQLKHTNFEDKQWVCQGVNRRFRSAMHTNSNVNAVLKFAPHAHNCTPYSNILHKIEKYLNAEQLKKRSSFYRLIPAAYLRI
ncbi:hypothetical protein T12_8023 [Trichinella patagoniensis]|uniref:FLYWCH-type domain-containing protein n=1 Tax=Trichinella patagoniensis TaxID=990121 RepID=A0A0V0Z7D2_9BILA|nr:hypothetical protein T12_8023 [Trichinella patagoniensis]